MRNNYSVQMNVSAIVHEIDFSFLHTLLLQCKAQVLKYSSAMSCVMSLVFELMEFLTGRKTKPALTLPIWKRYSFIAI